MQKIHFITSNFLTIEKVQKIVNQGFTLALSEKTRQIVTQSRCFLDQLLQKARYPVYGINTGFGSLCDIEISQIDIIQLQKNLVMSHACGIGDAVPKNIIRIMLFLKIQNLAYGYSGVRVELLEKLIEWYNSGALPVLYEQGSLGASGDLAPLAHLSLPLIGLGKVYFEDQVLTTQDYLVQNNIQPIVLHSKEGLALLNGTQFCTAYSVYCLSAAKRLMGLADLCAAVALEGFNAKLEPFDAKLQAIRPHRGQEQTARLIRQTLLGSQIAAQPKTQVQDPYSFRCVPQVHGASRDAIDYFEKIVTTEVNAVTDNPTVFFEDDVVLSGGNFHAQPLALGLDFLAMALAELGNISERRVFQLLSGKRGLPLFLTPKAGLHSGMMILQYTAASIVSQNKQFCTPASVDSIVSSNGQEDHVSMGANAATKCLKVVENLEKLLSIEWMIAMQALEYQRQSGLKSSPKLEKWFKKYRKVVPTLENDRVLSEDIAQTTHFLRLLN
ncbi:MAG: Histidine ammonia-lyase [Bacteroidota bacterium]|jgi:histidine ammonia-lyase